MIIDDYLEIQQKYEKKYGAFTVVLMEVGSFYEVYGVDNKEFKIGKVEEVARLLDIQMTRKNKKIAENSFRNPLLAGFPSFCLQKYLERLVENDFTVVVVEQDRPGSGAKRNVTNVYSPGVCVDVTAKLDYQFLMVIFFEQHFHKNNKNLSETAIGVSLIDLSTGQTRLYEFFSDYRDKNSGFDSLLRLIQNYQPREVVCISEQCPVVDVNSRDHQYSLEQYLNLSGRKTHYRWNDFHSYYKQLSFQKDILEKYFSNHGMLSVLEFLNLEKHSYALQGYLQMLLFIEDHVPSLLENLDKPEFISEKGKLILAQDCATQLHIISATNQKNKTSCLLDIINHTSTPMGKRLLKDRLLVPDTDPEVLTKRYDEIDRCHDYIDIFRELLTNIQDIERLHRKALLGKLSPTQFYSLHECFKYVLLIASQDYFDTPPKFVTLLQKYIISYSDILELDKCACWNLDQIDENPFKPGVSQHLDEYQSKVEKHVCFFTDTVIEMSKAIDPGFVHNSNNSLVKIEYNEREGYHFSVTKKRLEILKKHWPTENIDKSKVQFKSAQSVSNKVVKIFSPEIKYHHEERTKYQTLLGEQGREEFVKRVTDWHLQYHELFLELIDWIANLDVALSNAITAKKYNYHRPTIFKDENHSWISCKKLRHPIIERIQHDISYVPNDVVLGTADQRAILLYGVNACGKSSLMRSVGCAVILAQAGCFVPAEEMKLSPYSYLFTRISNNDNLFKGQSSFAVEMSELRSILQRANRHSLVLGDELCSGTESTSALAIVAAGVETLAKLGSSFVFATHLHPLAKLDNILAFTNIHHYHLKVHFDPVTQKLIYNRTLTPGSGSSMYGIEVCRAMDLPDDFITRANEIRKNITGEKQLPQKSHFNTKVLCHDCQICHSVDNLEVHHINFQCTADSDKMIDHLPKDHKSNLVVLCRKCHRQVHYKDLVIHGYQQTSNGIELVFEKNQVLCQEKKKITHPRKITPEIKELVISLLRKPHTTRQQTKQRVFEQKGVSLSLSSISMIWKQCNKED